MKIFQALVLGMATVAGTVSADGDVTDVSQRVFWVVIPCRPLALYTYSKRSHMRTWQVRTLGFKGCKCVKTQNADPNSTKTNGAPTGNTSFAGFA